MSKPISFHPAAFLIASSGSAERRNSSGASLSSQVKGIPFHLFSRMFSSFVTPPRCPQANGIAERFVGSVRREVLDRMIFFGVGTLTTALTEFVDHHYLRERNHQGIGNELIQPELGAGAADGVIRRRDRIGGLLKYYHRAAA